jgi:hypothetical protein
MRKILAILSAAICLGPGLGSHHALAQQSTYSLVMVTFVNNGNPAGLVMTTQTIIGVGYNKDNCGNAAKAASGTNPDKNTLQHDDMLRLYFVCVPNAR